MTKFLKKFYFVATFLVLFCVDVFGQNLGSSIVPITTDSRIKTLVYNPNEVFELKFYYGYQSFIEFSQSEEIEMISIGEAFAWRITPSSQRLFIRPLEIAAHTNMTIITNKRTYHFDIKSGEYNGKADEELVYTVRFYYPQIGQPLPIPPQLAAPRLPKLPVAQKSQPRPRVRTPSPKGLFSEPHEKPNIARIRGNPQNRQLNFDYSMTGKAKNITPIKVYDDGVETFMQFANDNAIVPHISAVDAYGVESHINYIIRDDFIVFPNIAKQYTLRLGDSLLCIYNNKIIIQ